MSKADKLIARIRARPVEADFDDVAKLLQHFGWEEVRQEGSHVSFGKDGEPSIVIPKKHGRKVKRTYLDQICERLGLDEDLTYPTRTHSLIQHESSEDTHGRYIAQDAGRISRPRLSVRC